MQERSDGRAFFCQQPWERAADPPQGWIALPAPGGFNFTFGPVFATRTGQDDFAVGFRCSERHLNPSGYCHGSALAAFADMQAYGVQHLLGYETAVVPTISISIDFLSVVGYGDWVRGDIEITRASRNLVFASLHGTVEGRPVMSARAIFKRMAMSQLQDRSYFDMVGPQIERSFAALDRD